MASNMAASRFLALSPSVFAFVVQGELKVLRKMCGRLKSRVTRDERKMSFSLDVVV